MADNELAHFGVRGMKWGVRRAERPAPSSDALSTKQYKTTVKRGGTDALSTKELQALVTRMNLEQQYSRLKPPAKGSAAKKFVSGILLNVGTQYATKLVSDQLNSQMGKLLANKK